jgi:serine-type D-Ala-D-Ala carboxypeptidase/endopeptidase (penicillin-binding protein 4)
MMRRIATAAMLLVACSTHAELPQPVGQAFVDAGVPLQSVALVVQEVGATRPLFAHDPTRPMNPASVMKLVTTYAALELLGRDYRWKTEAFLGGPLVDGVLHGDLIIRC